MVNGHQQEDITDLAWRVGVADQEFEEKAGALDKEDEREQDCAQERARQDFAEDGAAEQAHSYSLKIAVESKDDPWHLPTSKPQVQWRIEFAIFHPESVCEELG